MRLLSIVGNRPQFIKSGPLSLALREEGIDEVVLHTGQHYDPELSAVFFDELGLAEPAYRLEAGSGTHAAQTARMLPGIEAAIVAERPDAVVVFGDTNSTLAGALAAAKLAVPVAHVEAGVRSFVRSMPEEVNRILVDRLSTLLFCPSESAVAILETEGITEGVHVVGDVMQDACLTLAPIARKRSTALATLGVTPGEYVLATLHRDFNVQPGPLRAVAEALGALDEPVVFPAHPRTRAALEEAEIELAANILLIPPAGYLDFAALTAQARVVATDSGGAQKEAYWLGVPCVVFRDETEWVETVATGWSTLAGASDAGRIAAAIAAARPQAEHPGLYGDGRAAPLIARTIASR